MNNHEKAAALLSVSRIAMMYEIKLSDAMHPRYHQQRSYMIAAQGIDIIRARELVVVCTDDLIDRKPVGFFVDDDGFIRCTEFCDCLVSPAKFSPEVGSYRSVALLGRNQEVIGEYDFHETVDHIKELLDPELRNNLKFAV